MASLAKFRASMGVRMGGVRDQIRVIAHELRQWLAELRNQIRSTAGDSRQRMSDIREDTAEILRNIVPRGRA